MKTTNHKVLELRAFIRGGEEITPELEKLLTTALDNVLEYHSKSIKDKTDRIIHHTSITLTDVKEDKEFKYLDELQDNYFGHTEKAVEIYETWNAYKDIRDGGEVNFNSEEELKSYIENISISSDRVTSKEIVETTQCPYCGMVVKEKLLKDEMCSKCQAGFGHKFITEL